MKVVKDLLLTSSEAGMHSFEGSSPTLIAASDKNLPRHVGKKISV